MRRRYKVLVCRECLHQKGEQEAYEHEKGLLIGGERPSTKCAYCKDNTRSRREYFSKDYVVSKTKCKCRRTICKACREFIRPEHKFKDNRRYCPNCSLNLGIGRCEYSEDGD